MESHATTIVEVTVDETIIDCLTLLVLLPPIEHNSRRSLRHVVKHWEGHGPDHGLQVDRPLLPSEVLLAVLVLETVVDERVSVVITPRLINLASVLDQHVFVGLM